MKVFGIPMDMGGLVALVMMIAGIWFFFFNVYDVNLSQAQTIASLTTDVNMLKEAIPAIQRSLGRIEGHLGIKNNDDFPRGNK